MPADTKRHREQRHAAFLVRSGTAIRRPLDFKDQVQLLQVNQCSSHSLVNWNILYRNSALTQPALLAILLIAPTTLPAAVEHRFAANGSMAHYSQSTHADHPMYTRRYPHARRRLTISS